MKQARQGSQTQDPAVGRGQGGPGAAAAVDEDSDRPDWAQGNRDLNPHAKGGGQPADAGDKKGDLYGDLYVLLRDLDPNDDDDDINGEPQLDANGNEILIGSDGSLIYKTADGDIPEDELPLVQEVEFSRLSVARSPTQVMDQALDEALTQLAGGGAVELDVAGRIVVDGATIDSPLENLALYQYLMTADQDGWPSYIPDNVDIAALFGAAADKTTAITIDTLIYENTILGVNEVDRATGEVTFEDFSNYDYSRADKFGDVEISWYANIDDDPELELLTDTVLNAVFDGNDWDDAHPAAGVDDFAQAADDARAVINFLHNETIVEPDLLIA